MLMCTPMNASVPPLSFWKFFAQACLEGFDLVCSICKLTRRGVKVLCVCGKQYTPYTLINVKHTELSVRFAADVYLNTFNLVTQRQYYWSWWGANENKWFC